MKHGYRQSALTAAVTAGILLSGSQAYGAGFQISESSVSGLGRAFAGAGVAGDDLSDMFYNPAGLMLLSDERQFQIGGTFISSSGKVVNNGSTQSFATTGGILTVPVAGDDADGGEDSLVPNLYYAFPRYGNYRFGININAPFGLATDYKDGWFGQFHALRSELTTVDLNPSVAYSVTPDFTIGGGISLQKADAELSQAQFLGPGLPAGEAKIEGDDTSVGFNFGFMYAPTADARIGFGYRSKIEQEVDGDLKISIPGLAVPDAGATATVELPETAYLSAFKQLNNQWSFLASARWTKWSRFDELRIEFDNGLPDAVTDESWEDVWTFSVGLDYQANQKWNVRFGVAADESPVPDVEHRTPRIPDDDRTWLTVGASYHPTTNVSVDFGFAHLFIDDSEIDNTIELVSTAPGAARDNLRADIENPDANLIGIQVQVKL